MIVPPTSVRVFVATKPVDFRKGMDGLAAIVENELKLEPYSGVIYVFRAKRADRVKLLFWDGTGVSLLTKRLEGGKFHRGRRDAVVTGAALGAFGRARLAPRPCAPCRPSHSDAIMLARGDIPAKSRPPRAKRLWRCAGQIGESARYGIGAQRSA